MAWRGNKGIDNLGHQANRRESGSG
jgi:hypothetical protein